MSETTSGQKNLISFALGVLVASALWFGLSWSGITKLGRTQQTANTLQQQAIAKLENTNAQLQNSLQTAIATEQNDATAVSGCNAKFARATILYDVGLLNSETRAWIIPADVDPIVIGGKRGTYSHYDPKTQMETVHLQPKTQ